MENLDSMTEEQLNKFHHKHRWENCTPAIAAELFPDKPSGHMRATWTLAQYALYKSLAMNFRKHGYIESARIYERYCEEAYKKLPEYARW